MINYKNLDHRNDHSFTVIKPVTMNETNNHFKHWVSDLVGY